MQTEKYYSGKETEFQKIRRSPSSGLEQFHSLPRCHSARLKGNTVVPVTGPSPNVTSQSLIPCHKPDSWLLPGTVLRTAETMEGQLLLKESGLKNEEEFSAVQCSVPLLSVPGIKEQVLRAKGPDGGPRRCQGLHLNPRCVPNYCVPEHNPHRDTGSLGQGSEGHLDTNQGRTSYIWDRLMREKTSGLSVCPGLLHGKVSWMPIYRDLPTSW